MRSPSSLKGEKWINSPYKRSMDIALAISLMPAVAPIGATALVLARIIDGDGAIFRQQRAGKDGQIFNVNKIRTMKDSQSSHDTQSIKEITAFGRKIRPLAIDEIPQLWNVLNGSMSMVGPRALPVQDLEAMQLTLNRNLYDEWLHAFYSSKPGGISSYNIAYRTNGFTEEGYVTKANMDIKDFKNASLSHDLKLIKKAANLSVSLMLSKKPDQLVNFDAGNT